MQDFASTSTVTLNEYKKLSKIEELLRLGLRPPEVHALTGHNLKHLRKKYEEIHGEKPKQGRVSVHANKKINTLTKNLEIIR
jgi:uncharacterized protein (UPF0371 family)